MDNRKIKLLRVEDYGLVYASEGEIITYQTGNETWFIQGNKEFNGRYVIEIEYENQEPERSIS